MNSTNQATKLETLPGPWSLGEMTGNWRDIDLPDHGGVMRIVWKMEDDEGRNDALEAQAHAVVAALNAASHTPMAGQQVIIDFAQVGTAGPFPVVNGHVKLPSTTMLDLARMLRPTYEAAPGVGNGGFDHQTAADFLSGKTISDESVRKFVRASRRAHDEKEALGATLLSVRGVLSSREAEIALLKRALMEAEAAPRPAPLSDDDLVELGKSKKSRLYPWGIGTTRADYLRAARAVLAASYAPAEQQAQPGAVYAELPVQNYPKSGGFPGSFAEVQMRDFADRTHALRMEQAAPKAVPGEQDDHQILAITIAYEQGVGKGRQAYSSGKEISNPYDTAYRCDLAWQYGYKEGKEQAERIAKAAPKQAAPKAAPGEREQAAQRLRELGGISPDDVTDPLHPRYIEGYKAGHAAGRKRAAPQQEAQEPCGWPADRVRIEKTEKNGWCAYLDIQDEDGNRTGTINLCRGINSENAARALAQNWLRDFIPNPKQVAAPQPAPSPPALDCGSSSGGKTPRSNELEAARLSMKQTRTPAYGDALKLCRRLETELQQAQSALRYGMQPLTAREADELWLECAKKYKRPGPAELIKAFCELRTGAPVREE